MTKVPTSVPIVCRINNLNCDKRAPAYCPGEKCPEQCANFGAPNLACRRGPFCAPDSHFPRGSVPILVEKHAKSARAISYLNHRSCGLPRFCPALPNFHRLCPALRCHPTPFGSVSSRAGPQEDVRMLHANSLKLVVRPTSMAEHPTGWFASLPVSF